MMLASILNDDTHVNVKLHEVPLHAVTDHRRHNLPKHLNPRQRSVVRQRAARASLVDPVNEVDVPAVGWLLDQRPFLPHLRNRRPRSC